MLTQNKTERVSIRLTPEEREMLEEQASLEHLSLAQYIRLLLWKEFEKKR